MFVEFIEAANLELDDAIKYYNHQMEGLGDEFLDDVFNTIQLIKLFPEAWTQISNNTKKTVLKKFPFNLIYTIHDDKIYKIAVAHQHRKPDYWIDRLIDDE